MAHRKAADFNLAAVIVTRLLKTQKVRLEDREALEEFVLDAKELAREDQTKWEVPHGSKRT